MSNRSNSVTEQVLEGAVLNNVIAIGTNSTDIGNNTTAIGVNAGNISTNTGDIVVLQGQVSALEGVEPPGTWGFINGYGGPPPGEYQMSPTGVDFSARNQIRINKLDKSGVELTDLLQHLSIDELTLNIKTCDLSVSHVYGTSNYADLTTYVQFDLVYNGNRSYGTGQPQVAICYSIGPLTKPLQQVFGYTFADNVNDTPISAIDTWVDISNPSISGLPSIYTTTAFWNATEPGAPGQETPTFTYSGPITRVWQIFVTFDVENNNGGGADISFRITINNVGSGVVRRQTMNSGDYQIVSGVNFVPFAPGDALRFQLQNNSNTDNPLITNLAINFVLID